MNAMRVIEERGDAAETVAVQTPAVKKHEMARGRLADRLIDQAGSVVIEAFDAGDCAAQGESR